MEVMSGLQPMKRTGMPEDVGRAVAFLADNTKASFATGTEVDIDGGCRLSPSIPT